MNLTQNEENVFESLKLIRRHFPHFVLNSFKIEDWVKNYQKLKDSKSKDVLKVYDTYYSPKQFLDKYISIYKKLM